jgi:type I restriction-modification system DNA methylase subunit
MESILFVDATKQYAPTKNINRIEPGHIEFILQALGSGDCPDSDTCFRVPRKEIVRNKANLTLGFYASARGKNMSDPEDLTEIKSSIRQLNQDLSEALDENRRVVESMLHER